MRVGMAVGVAMASVCVPTGCGRSDEQVAQTPTSSAAEPELAAGSEPDDGSGCVVPTAEQLMAAIESIDRLNTYFATGGETNSTSSRWARGAFLPVNLLAGCAGDPNADYDGLDEVLTARYLVAMFEANWTSRSLRPELLNASLAIGDDELFFDTACRLMDDGGIGMGVLSMARMVDRFAARPMLALATVRRVEAERGTPPGMGERWLLATLGTPEAEAYVAGLEAWMPEIESDEPVPRSALVRLEYRQEEWQNLIVYLARASGEPHSLRQWCRDWIVGPRSANDVPIRWAVGRLVRSGRADLAEEVIAMLVDAIDRQLGSVGITSEHEKYEQGHNIFAARFASFLRHEHPDLLPERWRDVPEPPRIHVD